MYKCCVKRYDLHTGKQKLRTTVLLHKLLKKMTSYNHPHHRKLELVAYSKRRICVIFNTWTYYTNDCSRACTSKFVKLVFGKKIQVVLYLSPIQGACGKRPISHLLWAYPCNFLNSPLQQHDAPTRYKPVEARWKLSQSPGSWVPQILSWVTYRKDCQPMSPTVGVSYCIVGPLHPPQRTSAGKYTQSQRPAGCRYQSTRPRHK